MIKDRLTNAEVYYRLSDNLKKGFEWLKNTDLNSIEDGRYYIDGENIFANVQSYETKADAPYEAHRKYIDIQYMTNGVEKVGVCNYTDCTSKDGYNEEKDLEFLSYDKSELFQTLESGDFLVFYPHDAHKPSLIKDKPLFVKKVIVKVAI